MNETEVILEAFDLLCAEQKPAALATVVRVAGSSYRRPGARMLVAADGRTWGGVSGGCLERDVSRRARNVIGNALPQICCFDTSEDFNGGAALGCAGIIDILIEPISPERPGPFPALRRAIVERRPVAIGTIIQPSTDGPALATRYDLDDAPPPIREALQAVAQTGAGGVQTCDGSDIFFEHLRPPQSLVLFGGGPDVVPLVAIVKTLGWHVTVVASHAAIGYRERFAEADLVSVGTDDDPLGGVSIEPDAAIVMMTHNYPRDLLLLPLLLARPLRYLGVLGPRRRAERLVLESPHVPPDAIRQLHAPVGMDLGAEAPETIALAIVAEIQAVLCNRPCPSLRDREGPIYAADPAIHKTPYNPTACPISA